MLNIDWVTNCVLHSYAFLSSMNTDILDPLKHRVRSYHEISMEKATDLKEITKGSQAVSECLKEENIVFKMN